MCLMFPSQNGSVVSWNFSNAASNVGLTMITTRQILLLACAEGERPESRSSVGQTSGQPVLLLLSLLSFHPRPTTLGRIRLWLAECGCIGLECGALLALAGPGSHRFQSLARSALQPDHENYVTVNMNLFPNYEKT
ncbi:hypothetical protein PanWU01x14_230660 [Parasponia andersonii]|uniref:Uncharacterized protein n=1 Tax=Parasponia andersonii TaxID=3476 RepID=A0A2P5BKT0_PARAD|nr:hypothetical protein PanWU01x14_230660 [Parasponia andersonii]